MSFHDFAHLVHRYGVMTYAKPRDSEEENDQRAAAVRRVFDSVRKRGWPGDANVRLTQALDVASFARRFLALKGEIASA